MRFGQDPLGEINPFVQVGHFLPQSIHLRQKLRILSRFPPAAETIGQGLAHRTY
jgi:hypothetical protein